MKGLHALNIKVWQMREQKLELIRECNTVLFLPLAFATWVGTVYKADVLNMHLMGRRLCRRHRRGQSAWHSYVQDRFSETASAKVDPGSSFALPQVTMAHLPKDVGFYAITAA